MLLRGEIHLSVSSKQRELTFTTAGEAPASAAVWVQHNKANTSGVKEVAKDLSGIAPVIPIDRLDTLPLHRQICEGFRAAILRGNLQPGQPVPSSRHLAEDLEVSRFPVLDAYAQLLSEGYFESRVGSGTFVSTSLPGQLPHDRRSRSTTGGSRCLSRRSSLLGDTSRKG